MQVVTWRRG